VVSAECLRLGLPTKFAFDPADLIGDGIPFFEKLAETSPSSGGVKAYRAAWWSLLRGARTSGESGTPPQEGPMRRHVDDHWRWRCAWQLQVVPVATWLPETAPAMTTSVQILDRTDGLALPSRVGCP